MRGKLFIQASARFALGLASVGLLLFVPAGTMAYPNAWLFIGVLFIPILILGTVLLLKAPGLLAKRLNTREKQADQRQVISASLFMFVGGFTVAGLDFRYGWSALPRGVSVGAAAVLLLAYGLFARVLEENAYLSRTVEIQDDQQVIDTGPYGLVRHPMYSATVLLFLSIPLILGSVYAFVIFLAYPVLLVRRIAGEEAVLAKGLPGYTAYMERVRYRLIPFIW